MSSQFARKLLSRFLFVGVVISFYVSGCRTFPNTENAFPVITEVFISHLSGFNEGDLREYELTPSGNFLYSFSGQLLDIRTGNLQSEFGYFGIPMHLSPDGRYMTAAYSVPENSEDSNLTKTNMFVHDLNTNILLDGLSEGLAPISWAPDSSHILMGDFKTIISVPDMQTNTAWGHTVNFREIDSIAGDQNILWDKDQNIPIAIISGCGLNCLIGKSDNATQKVDWGLIPISGVTNRQENTNIENFFGLSLPDAVVDWSFDPSGQYVVFAIWNQSAMPLEFDQTISKNVLDSTLVLVDWRTKQSIELLKLSKVDPQNYIIQWGGSLRWSSDGSTLLVPREGAEALVLKLKYPSGTNFRKDAYEISIIDEPIFVDKIAIEKVQEWKNYSINDLLWLPDSERFIVLGGNSDISERPDYQNMFAYSINNHEILWSAKENSIYGFSYDPGHSSLGISNFEAISIRNVDTGQEETPIVNRDFPATQCIERTDIKFFSDGSKIVTLESSFDTYDSQIYIWDETSEKCLGKLTEQKGYAFDLHLSQDNNYLGIALFSGRDDENRVSNYVQIWDLSDEKKICTYENSGPMALSPDGKISASINIVNGNDIEIWDVRSCELIETIVRKPDNRPYSLDIDRKGELLAMGGENTIQIWRIEDQKLLFETENLYNNVSNIRFSPDGKYLLSAIQRLSGNDEGIITLWEIIN